MTIYAYKCRACGQRYESFTRANALDDVTCACGGNAEYPHPTRDYSGISTQRPMEPHFNPATQTEIRSERQFAEQLRVQGLQYTERTGIPCSLAPVDPTDTKALGITEEGLDATNRRRVDVEGLPPIRLPK